MKKLPVLRFGRGEMITPLKPKSEPTGSSLKLSTRTRPSAAGPKTAWMMPKPEPAKTQRSRLRAWPVVGIATEGRSPRTSANLALICWTVTATSGASFRSAFT